MIALPNLQTALPGLLLQSALMPIPSMKLFAFKDRLDDPDKEFGRSHALDMYTILATTMEGEWERALALGSQHGEEPYIVEAGRLVAKYFSTLDRLGMIRLRESRYYQSAFQLDEFMSALEELFPASAGAARSD